MEPWPQRARRERLALLRATLVECQDSLNSAIRIPLNVACSDVLRGVLSRSREVLTVHVSTRVQNRQQEFESKEATLPQIITLSAALSRSIYELDLLAHGEAAHGEAARGEATGQPLDDMTAALDYIRLARDVLLVPPHEVRFPHRFFDLGRPGFCGEVFVCEKTKLVFNLHAYQDNHHKSYTSTSTVSAKSTDSGLFEVWQKLDAILAR